MLVPPALIVHAYKVLCCAKSQVISSVDIAIMLLYMAPYTFMPKIEEVIDTEDHIACHTL